MYICTVYVHNTCTYILHVYNYVHMYMYIYSTYYTYTYVHNELMNKHVIIIKLNHVVTCGGCAIVCSINGGFVSDEIVVDIVRQSMLGVVLGELCLHCCVSTIFHSEMLAAQEVLVCPLVGLKCWKFCWVSCACTVVCEYYLPFRDVGCTSTCVPIGWFEVLEVLLGELCLHCCVRVLSPLQRCWLHWYLCAYRLV